MRKVLLLFFTLFQVSIFYSQTYIDVIRASSYYSNAVTNYTNGEYQNALHNLQLSEKNLKGNTNRDLEYLKIMSHYQLGNYKKAYNLVTLYFQDDFLLRSKAFKNVTTFEVQKGLNYEEHLTTMFVSIEEKSTNNTPIEKSNNHIQNIINRISARKVSFSEYIKNGILPRTTEEITYCTREFSNNSSKRVYENNILTLIMSKTNQKYTFKYAGSINGKAITKSDYKVEVTFAPIKAKLQDDFYSYGFQQKNVKQLSGKIALTETVYQCNSLNAPKYNSNHFSNYLTQQLKNKSFTKREFNYKIYKVFFTQEESVFLRKDDNLSKLNTALKSKGLL